MNLTQIKNSISGEQMLTQLKNIKINSQILKTSAISAGISALIDESISMQNDVKTVAAAISSVSIGTNIDNRSIENPIHLGRNLSALTDKSIVIGNNVKTKQKDGKGWENIAIGNYIRATGKNSVAIGNGDDSFSANGHPNGDFGNRGADGDYSIAIGNAGAEGEGAIAIGQQAHAKKHGISIGRMQQKSGTTALEFSNDTCRKTGENSITIGTYALASADNAIAIGHGATATLSNQTIIGAPEQPADASHMTWIGRTADAEKIWFGDKNLADIVETNTGNVVNKAGDTGIGTLGLSANLTVGENVFCMANDPITAKGSIAAGSSSYVTPKSCMKIQSVTSCEIDNGKYYVIQVDGKLSSELQKININNPVAFNGNSSSIYANPQKITRIDAASGKLYFVLSDDISYGPDTVTTYFQTTCNKTVSDHLIIFYNQPLISGNYTFNTSGPAYSFGEINTVMCDDSIAVGTRNKSIGRGSCGIGFWNEAGHFATAIGGGNKAYAKYSIAMGCNTATNTTGTGNIPNVVIMNPASNAFAWSAGNGTADQYVISAKNRAGTFNINPVGDAGGFYIGHKNLPAIVREIVDGYNISDTNARVIAVDISGEELTTTTTAAAFVDEYIDKMKPVYVDGAEPEQKTSDEIKVEVEHLYAMTKEGEDQYAYYQIHVTQNEDNENEYEWRRVTEKNKTSYIKKEGDTDIGNLHLSGELSVDGKVSFEKGIYIGNAPETLYAPSANMMFALGQNLSVLGTNSMTIGSGCIAGTNVLSVVDMYFSDNHTNGMSPNTIKMDSVDGLAAGMTYLLKITNNYGTTGNILSVNAETKSYFMRLDSCNNVFELSCRRRKNPGNRR